MDADERVQENRLRRMAQRRGWRLVKSRRRDPRARDYGTYMLVNDYYNSIVYGENQQTTDLDEIEEWLTATP